ncbi:MAG: site-specific integrase [Lachnospiraceae bacterium]|nr:site-specific integrase [Lachnospiraceae bacterium]
MKIDNIKQKSYDTYLNYNNLCGNVDLGLACNYDMTREQILKNHTRKISYDDKKMLWRTYLDNNKPLTCKTREGLEEKLVIYYLENCAGLYTIDAVFERAAAFSLKNDFHAPSTIDRYRADFEKYVIGSNLDCDIRAITESDIIEFFNGIMKNKPKSKAVDNIRTMLNYIFAHARIQDRIECLHVKTVFDNLTYPRRAFAPKELEEDRVVVDDDMCILLKQLDLYNRTDLGILLFIHTALRVGEMCALRVEDFDFATQRIYIRYAETVSGRGKNRVYKDEKPKGNKESYVVMSDKAVEVAKMLCDMAVNGFVFARGDSHIHSRSFDSRLRRICRKCNIPSYSTHDIRRTYASHGLESGAPLSFIQHQLRHTDSKTTLGYACYSTKRNQDYINMANAVSI